MPIYAPSGQPVSAGQAVTFDSYAPRLEQSLSRRSAEILRSVTLWEMTRRLSPLLVCKHCYEESGKNYAHRNTWTVEIASTATGSILAQCGCTSWVCVEPVPLDTSDIPDTLIVSLEVIGKKQRPIGSKEAALLTAWRQVMLDHNWFETLSCQDCAKNTMDSFCKCATIPNKSVTIDCQCTERRWQGITN